MQCVNQARLIHIGLKAMQYRLQAVEDTIKALKVHSKRDVLCCWRNGLWAVARCIRTLRSAKLPSLTKPLYGQISIIFEISLMRSHADLILQPSLKAVLFLS